MNDVHYLRIPSHCLRVGLVTVLLIDVDSGGTGDEPLRELTRRRLHPICDRLDSRVITEILLRAGGGAGAATAAPASSTHAEGRCIR